MRETDTSGPIIIAVCGKGGVGKTSISGAIARILLERPGTKVLAVDADPAIGLAPVLGLDVTRTVDDIRTSLIETIGGGAGDRREILSRLDYQVFEAITEIGSLAFLAIGRPEKEGCYCKVNDLLREIIASLTGNFDYVIVDGEAGIEQVNRRVLERVTHLVQVSDASARGINVARTINTVARKAVHCDRSGLILNRIRDESELKRLLIPGEMNLLGWVPEDETVRDSDINGSSIFELKEGPFLGAVRDCLKRLGI